MRAFAAAMERSADATSGRRCNKSEGSPAGIFGSDAVASATGMANAGAGVPTRVAIACSNCAFPAACWKSKEPTTP